LLKLYYYCRSVIININIKQNIPALNILRNKNISFS
jgi:hypothetical protein